MSSSKIDPQKDTSKESPTVGLFFGSTTGATEEMSELIEDVWLSISHVPLTIFDVANLENPSPMAGFDKLIIGVPTWDIGQLQEDWNEIVAGLYELDFSGKQVALFGVGDQVGYPDSFVDAMGLLGGVFQAQNATLAGYWPTLGYEFTVSLAQEGDRFMGLALDEDNQADLSEARIEQWVAQVVAEFGVSKPLPVSNPNPTRSSGKLR